MTKSRSNPKTATWNPTEADRYLEGMRRLCGGKTATHCPRFGDVVTKTDGSEKQGRK